MIKQCYVLQLSRLDSFPCRQTAFLCHSLGNPWEATALATSGSQCCQPCHWLKGEEGLSVPGLHFTTTHWCLEKGIFAAPSHIVPFQQNHQILVLSVWHPLISTRKAHQCNSVYIALKILQDATELPRDFFSFLSLLLCCRLEQKDFQLIMCVFSETTNLHPS